MGEYPDSDAEASTTESENNSENHFSKFLTIVGLTITGIIVLNILGNVFIDYLEKSNEERLEEHWKRLMDERHQGDPEEPEPRYSRDEIFEQLPSSYYIEYIPGDWGVRSWEPGGTTTDIPNAKRILGIDVKAHYSSTGSYRFIQVMTVETKDSRVVEVEIDHSGVWKVDGNQLVHTVDRSTYLQAGDRVRCDILESGPSILTLRLLDGYGEPTFFFSRQ